MHATRYLAYLLGTVESGTLFVAAAPYYISAKGIAVWIRKQKLTAHGGHTNP
jgi:hypothetical protein